MPSRQYKTDPCQLLAEGQILINTTDDAKFQHKVELVNLVLSGLSPSFLSQYCAESKNTITSWVKTADEKGFDALRTKKQSLALAHAQGNRIGFCYIVGKAGAVPYRVSVFFRGVFPQDRFNLGQFFR